MQILPFENADWNSGAGSKGRAWAQGYVEIEICEDDLTDGVYFGKTYAKAVEVCAYICKQYGVSPEMPLLIDHAEAHTLGIASAHGDVGHWFPKFGKLTNTFRADVKQAVSGATAVVTTPTVETPKPTIPPTAAFVPYTVKVTVADLNIRTGPGTNYAKTKYTGIGVFTITAESDGAGAKKWGKLASGAGWISLDYTKKAK